MRKTKCHPQLQHHCRHPPSLNCWQQRKQKQNPKQRAKQRKPTFCVYLADSVPTRAETETCTRSTRTIPFHLALHPAPTCLWTVTLAQLNLICTTSSQHASLLTSVCRLIPESQTRAGTGNRLDSISGRIYHEMAHVHAGYRQLYGCPLALLVT